MSKAHKPPLSHSQLARMRVPGMDTNVIAAIDALEAKEAEEITSYRDRFADAQAREIDPLSAVNAAITPELSK